MSRKTLLLITLLLVLPLMAFSSQAQVAPFAQAGDDAACPAIVEDALASIADNCEGLGRNSACYGYTSVSAAFAEEVSADVFVQPADRVELAQLLSIQTAPLDVSLNQWGIAVMNVQANLPSTIPGQGVVFMLLGDTTVSSAVPADEAFIAAEPIPVAINTRANIRTGPGAGFNVLAVVEQGTMVEADAVTEFGLWVRVMYEGQIGWASEVLIDEDISSLPVISEGARSPMQAFYFTTGIGQPTCQQAPNVLLIQGPQEITVDLTVNEASIRISSTVLLETLNENTMQITVIDGQALVNNLLVPAGFKATAPIIPGNGQTQISGQPAPVIDGAWSGCEPLDEADRARITMLTGIPADLLHYSIEIPAETSAECGAPSSSQPGDSSAGDSGAGDSGAGGSSATEEATQPAPGGIDCTGFVITYPQPGFEVPYGSAQFFWDPAQGAARYRVVVLDSSGGVVGIIETGDPTTTVFLDTTLWSGDSFQAEVQALDSAGNSVCATPRVPFIRGQRSEDDDD